MSIAGEDEHGDPEPSRMHDFLGEHSEGISSEERPTPVSRDVEDEAGDRASEPQVLQRYVEWTPRECTSVHDGDREAILSELVEILAVEGPMHALRLYQLHSRAAGIERVRRQARQRYNRLLHTAIQRGTIAKISDDVPGLLESTIYLPDHPRVRVRELGPRSLYEVPRSEIRTLIERLRLSRSDAGKVKRRVLDAYGLRRLTQPADNYLTQCLGYDCEGLFEDR